MNFSVAQEVYVFLISVTSGIAIGFIYDLLRVIRRYSRSKDAITDVEDILFWAISIAIMFFAVFFSNNGTIRWYQFFGAILGAVFYFLALSRVICTIFFKIIQILLKIFLFFCKILLTPLLFMYNIVYKGILFIFVPIYRQISKLAKKLLIKMKTGRKRAKNALLKK